MVYFSYVQTPGMRLFETFARTQHTGEFTENIFPKHEIVSCLLLCMMVDSKALLFHTI